MSTIRLLMRALRFMVLLGLLAPSGSAWAAECPGDLNGDGRVDSADLEIFSRHFGLHACGQDCAPDMDEDGDVDGVDLARFIAAFARSGCAPEACPPIFAFLEPDGVLDISDKSFTLRWHDADPDQDAVISLYYDTDASGADGFPIVQGLSEDADGIAGNQAVWDTSGLPAGRYHIYAVIDDGRSPAYIVYGQHTVTVNHAVLDPNPIKAPPMSGYPRFGYAVAASGNTLIVGAPGVDPIKAVPGRTFVYTRVGNSWSEPFELPLQAADSSDGDYFGYAVDIDGDTAVVGAPRGLAFVSSGTAFIFQREAARWVLKHKVKPSDLMFGYYASLGHAVAVNKDRVAVGAPNARFESEGLAQRGAVYIYRREGSSWLLDRGLWASDKAAFDEFGTSVDILADKVLVGAPKNDDHGSDSGSAYIFTLVPGGGSEFKLTAADATAGAGFGKSVVSYPAHGRQWGPRVTTPLERMRARFIFSKRTAKAGSRSRRFLRPEAPFGASGKTWPGMKTCSSSARWNTPQRDRYATVPTSTGAMQPVSLSS